MMPDPPRNWTFPRAKPATESTTPASPISTEHQEATSHPDHSGPYYVGSDDEWDIDTSAWFATDRLKIKEARGRRMIGVPQLTDGTYLEYSDRVYISMREAVYQEMLGEDVELRFELDDVDQRVIELHAAIARRRTERKRHLPDGWDNRPIQTAPVDAPAAADCSAEVRSGVPLHPTVRALLERIQTGIRLPILNKVRNRQ